MLVSLTTITSAASRSFHARRNAARFSLPTSSSPSITSLMLTGSLPFTAKCAAIAERCMYTWPLSSQAPRA